jgi:DNA-binding transcriptional regulator YiaG
MSKGKKTSPLTPLGAAMVAGLSEFCDAIEAGEPIEQTYTVRTVTLDLHPRPYGPDDVKHVRRKFKASQALLAKFLGVSVKTVSAWEQGTRPVQPMACRYMDDLLEYPDLWEKRVRPVRPDGEPAADD